MNSTIKMNDRSAKAQNVSRMPAALAITICNLLSIFDACSSLLRSSTVRFVLKGSAFTVALFYVFGCVGAMETGSITFTSVLFRSAVALGSAALISYALREKEYEEG